MRKIIFLLCAVFLLSCGKDTIVNQVDTQIKEYYFNPRQWNYNEKYEVYAELDVPEIKTEKLVLINAYFAEGDKWCMMPYEVADIIFNVLVVDEKLILSMRHRDYLELINIPTWIKIKVVIYF